MHFPEELQFTWHVPCICSPDTMNIYMSLLLSHLSCAIQWLRNLMGEQLESLTFREVQQLEQQIDSALRNIRSRKVQVTCTLNVHVYYSHVSACSYFLIPTFRTTSCSTRSRSSERRQMTNKAITIFIVGEKTFFLVFFNGMLIDFDSSNS